MSTYKVPGVYVEERNTLPGSIVSVPTAVPVFIGKTESGDQNKAVRIESMDQFVEAFGGPFSYPGQNGTDFTNYTTDLDIKLKLIESFDNANRLIARTFEITEFNHYNFFLYYQVQMFFQNGGGYCYVVSVGHYIGAISTTNTTLEVKNPELTDYYDTGNDIDVFSNVLEYLDEPTLIICTDHPTTNPYTAFGNLMQQSLIHCNKMKDRFTIMDVPAGIESIPTSATLTDLPTDFKAHIGSSYLSYGAAYFPWVKSTLSKHFLDDRVKITAHVLNGVTLTTGGHLDRFLSDVTNIITPLPNDVYNEAKAAIAAYGLDLPPAGAVAGIYARTDKDVGVWKAPANTSLNGVSGPVSQYTLDDYGLLNIDTATGKSINAIRSFRGRGTLVYGARTLDGNSGEWKYVPVRRLYLTMEESIKKATQFVVFEPNTSATWLRTKSMIENYLTDLWRQGALAGATAKEAFFVNVGLNSTMTSADILEGRMIIEIGVAAVRPAEFIILRLEHKLQES